MRYLAPDVLWRVSQQDRGVGVTARHLGFKTLQGREENRVVASGLLIFEFLGHITCHSEVGVLIDGTGDQRGYISALAIDVWEGVTEGWH